MKIGRGGSLTEEPVEARLIHNYGSDERHRTLDHVMKIHSHFQPFDLKDLWRSPDFTKMVVMNEDNLTFRLINTLPNKIYDTDIKRVLDDSKITVSEYKCEIFAFSQCGRYLTISNMKYIAIVDLGDFQKFFDPEFPLEEKINEA